MEFARSSRIPHLPDRQESSRQAATELQAAPAKGHCVCTFTKYALKKKRKGGKEKEQEKKSHAHMEDASQRSAAARSSAPALPAQLPSTLQLKAISHTRN